MGNPCEACPRKCCEDFRITTEITQPIKVKENLSKYPFVKKTGTALVRGPGGCERVVGVYNCDRFDRSTGLCKDYDTLPRPSFCTNTGEKVSPHSQCLLKQ